MIRTRSRDAALGMALGTACWLLAGDVGIPQVAGLDPVHWVWAAAAIGGGIAFAVARAVTPMAMLAVALIVAAIAVAETPIGPVLARRLVRIDAACPRTDAIVVLSSRLSDDPLDAAALDRLLAGLARQRGGDTTDIVVSFGANTPTTQADQDLVARLAGVRHPLLRVGPVGTTRDEAVAVARLAAARHWRAIALVTSPTHSMRAAAVFERVGLRVCSAPSPGRDAPLRAPRAGNERARAFRAWLHESIAMSVYRMRGWA